MKNKGTKREVAAEKAFFKGERPISKVYTAIDNDLARDNLENDIPAADLNEL